MCGFDPASFSPFLFGAAGIGGAPVVPGELETNVRRLEIRAGIPAAGFLGKSVIVPDIRC